MERILVSTRLEQRQQAMRERLAPAAPTSAYPSSKRILEPLLTAKQAADLLQVSTATIARRFAGYPGTIDLSSPGPRGKCKRKYSVLRIPLPVLQRFLAERSGGAA